MCVCCGPFSFKLLYPKRSWTLNQQLTSSIFIANNEMKSSLKFFATVLSTNLQSCLQILQLDRHFKTFCGHSHYRMLHHTSQVFSVCLPYVSGNVEIHEIKWSFQAENMPDFFQSSSK